MKFIVIRSDGSADLYPNLSATPLSKSVFVNDDGCFSNVSAVRRVEVDYRFSWTHDWQWALLWPLDSAVFETQGHTVFACLGAGDALISLYLPVGSYLHDFLPATQRRDRSAVL
jgi:hypothetical protein